MPPSVGKPARAPLTTVNRTVRRLALVLLAAAAACQPVAPPTATPPPTVALPAPPAVVPPTANPSPTVALPAMDLPPGPIYACDAGGTRTPIVFPGNVESLCRRHPEMTACQYERDQCRKRGGRVYTAKGDEVTPAIEAEYDKRVYRVTFQGDGPAPKRQPGQPAGPRSATRDPATR